MTVEPFDATIDDAVLRTCETDCAAPAGPTS